MDNSINSALALVGVISMGAILLAAKAVLDTKKEKIFQNQSVEIASKKIFKLFNNDGILIREYKNVYVTNWDTNIYLLSHEYKGKYFIRIDKGENMLLTSESVEQDEKNA